MSSRRIVGEQAHAKPSCGLACTEIGTMRGLWSRACSPSRGTCKVTRKAGCVSSSPCCTSTKERFNPPHHEPKRILLPHPSSRKPTPWRRLSGIHRRQQQAWRHRRHFQYSDAAMAKFRFCEPFIVKVVMPIRLPLLSNSPPPDDPSETGALI